MSPGASREPCPSDLVLDRYLVGELGEADRQALEEHARGCGGCRALLDERRQQMRRCAEAASLPGRAAATLERWRGARPSSFWSRPRTWAAGLTAALATAAALLLVLLPRHGEGPTRLKGGFALSAFVKRGEAVAPASSGDVFHPGDALRFAYTADRDGYLVLASVDARQVVSVYYPASQQPAAAASAGAGRLLPGSTILDRTLGAETVIAVHCRRPFTVAAVRQRAKPIVSALRSGREVSSLLPQHGCRVARFELRKQP